MEWIIFNISEINKIDFSQVNEDSVDTLRLSVDETKTFVNWEGKDQPAFLSRLETSEGPYTKDEIWYILQTDEWKHKLIIPS
jgi:hypothetical protein